MTQKFQSILFFFLFITCTGFAEQPETPPGNDTATYQYELSAAMIFRDEAPYLKEWIEYHKLVGVEHFYLYNNLSTDNYKEVLTPYILAGEVDLKEWPFESHNVAEWDVIQVNACNHALEQAKGHSKWLAVIDMDEFLVPVADLDMITLLRKYDNAGGVYNPWVVFGTSWVKKIPDDKLLIEMLVHNGASQHSLGKSIIRTEYTIHIRPHHATYIPGKAEVQIPIREMQINHYWSRDEYYLYNFKIPRRALWGTDAATCIRWATYATTYSIYSEPILRFVPPLRAKMGFQ